MIESARIQKITDAIFRIKKLVRNHGGGKASLLCEVTGFQSVYHFGKSNANNNPTDLRKWCGYLRSKRKRKNPQNGVYGAERLT